MKRLCAPAHARTHGPCREQLIFGLYVIWLMWWKCANNIRQKCKNMSAKVTVDQFSYILNLANWIPYQHETWISQQWNRTIISAYCVRQRQMNRKLSILQAGCILRDLLGGRSADPTYYQAHSVSALLCANQRRSSRWHAIVAIVSSLVLNSQANLHITCAK